MNENPTFPQEAAVPQETSKILAQYAAELNGPDTTALGASALAELLEEERKRKVNVIKQQMRGVALSIKDQVGNLRTLRRAEEQVKAALAGLNKLLADLTTTPYTSDEFSSAECEILSKVPRTVNLEK